MDDKKTFKNWIVFTITGDGAPIAYKLQQEGKDVLLAVVDNAKAHGVDETPEEKTRRLSLFDGLLKKIPAEKLLKKLAKVPNKDDYFLFFDLNTLWKFSQACLKMGFKYGNFYTKSDLLLESDRELAKELVKKHYPGLKVAPTHEFKKVEDALKFLEEDKGNFWALKGDSDHGAKTVVPVIEDEEMAKKQIIEALTKDTKPYEAGGFILEMRIPSPIEVTPAAFFWNGELSFLDIDLENKPIGAGNIGYQVGAAQSLICHLEKDSYLAEVLLPDVVHKMAKKHTGLFNIDAGILIDRRDGSMYFSEYCTRPGYDAIFAEICMGRSVSGFFEDIVNGVNPLIRDYGAAVRLFNLPHKAPYQFRGDDLKDMEVGLKTQEGLWFFDLKKEDTLKTTGYNMDAAVATGYGKDVESAVSMAYDNAELYGLKNVYFRPESDFLGQYKTSILERWNYIKNMTENRKGLETEKAPKG